MADMLLIVGSSLSGNDVSAKDRATIFNKVEAHVGDPVLLSHEAWQAIAFAAKTELLRQYRKQARANKRSEPRAAFAVRESKVPHLVGGSEVEEEACWRPFQPGAGRRRNRNFQYSFFEEAHERI